MDRSVVGGSGRGVGVGLRPDGGAVPGPIGSIRAWPLRPSARTPAAPCPPMRPPTASAAGCCTSCARIGRTMPSTYRGPN